MRLRFLCPFLILFFVDTVQAQISLYGGPQITSAKYTINSIQQPTTSKIGFSVGAGIENQIEGPIYFAPSIHFSLQGYKVVFNQPAFPPATDAKDNDVSLSTIELAPLFQINISKAVSHLFVRFGPSMNVAVAGKETYDSLHLKTIAQNMTFSFGDYSLVTIAGNVQIGYQHSSGISVLGRISHGLTSLNNADYGPMILHQTVGLSIGYRLGKRK